MAGTATHPFTPRDDDATRCGHALSDAPGYAGGTCGFLATNRSVHAPGAKPVRHLALVRQGSGRVESTLASA